MGARLHFRACLLGSGALRFIRLWPFLRTIAMLCVFLFLHYPCATQRLSVTESRPQKRCYTTLSAFNIAYLKNWVATLHPLHMAAFIFDSLAHPLLLLI